MAKQAKPRSFDDVLSLLGSQRFDVAGAAEGAQRKGGGAVRVSKYGCAAEIGAAPAEAASATMLLAKPGFVLGGEICRILDRGYQKFLRNSKLEIPATAAHLRAIHEFTIELNGATGEMTLFNESLGSTSDKYEYDRVAGRPDQPVREF